MDLGCGTGLCGPLLRDILPQGSRLTGVDLSIRMLDKAAKRQCYDNFVESDIVVYLKTLLEDIVEDISSYDDRKSKDENEINMNKVNDTNKKIKKEMIEMN